MPTPGVAYLTRTLRADIGVMISASHNSYEDNGIKLFGPDGFKLSDDIEREIESFMDDGVGELSPPKKLGRAKRIDDAQGAFILKLAQTHLAAPDESQWYENRH